MRIQDTNYFPRAFGAKIESLEVVPGLQRWYAEYARGYYVRKFLSFVLDDNDFPHIVYVYTYECGDAIRYAHYDGESWQVETITDCVGAINTPPSVQIHAGYLHIRALC